MLKLAGMGPAFGAVVVDYNKPARPRDLQRVVHILPSPETEAGLSPETVLIRDLQGRVQLLTWSENAKKLTLLADQHVEAVPSMLSLLKAMYRELFQRQTPEQPDDQSGEPPAETLFDSIFDEQDFHELVAWVDVFEPGNYVLTPDNEGGYMLDKRHPQKLSPPARVPPPWSETGLVFGG